MILALCLGVAAIVTLLAAPSLLTIGRWQIRYPRLALTAWFGAFGAGCAMAVSAVLLSVLSALAASVTATVAEAMTLTTAAWLGLGGIGAVIAFVGACAEPLTASLQGSVERLAPVAVSRECRRGFTLVRFASEDPVACALPGRNPEILVSTRLETLLTSPQLQAVLAHEYAHLRMRHGWAVRIAEVNAICLPRFLKAGHGFKRATLLLVELIADDAAARQAGAAHLANALSAIATVRADVGLVLRAERLTLRRWPKIRHRRMPVAVRV